MQLFSHLIHYVLSCDSDRIVNYAFVQISNCILHNLELVEQHSSSLQHFVAEVILLAIDPKIGEALLC